MTCSLGFQRKFCDDISPKLETSVKFCIRNEFMDVMTHAKFHFNQLMLTLIDGIRASEPPSGLANDWKGLIGLCFIILYSYFTLRLHRHNCFYSSLEGGIVSAAVCGKVGESETATQTCQHSTLNFWELKQWSYLSLNGKLFLERSMVVSGGLFTC